MPNRLLEPLTKAPSRLAGSLANKIDDPNAADRSQLKGFLAGALEGAGDLASDMTSPLSLALSALGPSAGLIGRLVSSGKRAAPAASSAMSRIAAPARKMMPEFGPGAFTVSDDVFAAENAARSARQAANTARRESALKNAYYTDDFANLPSSDEVATMMAKRKANVPEPPRAVAEVPLGPSENVMPRVRQAMSRQDKINEARKRSQRARNFRGNVGDE